jgi:AGZA family xanthine/uracil permease-like MFS transporter
MTPRYHWATRGDINAFFGLILDNTAVMSVLLVLITSSDSSATNFFSREFVFRQMIPGTALGVVIGDLVYTWLAFRLARRTGRTDVTAMPLGLDTPSTFAVGTLVLVPALRFGMDKLNYDHREAMFFAWHVGAVLLAIIGVAKSVVAPLGSAVRKWVPRAGLLGSLAGIALALIALVPLWENIASLPLVGMVTLIFILVTLVAHRPLPGRVPGALAAVALGAVLYWSLVKLGPAVHMTLVPPPPDADGAAQGFPQFLPGFARNWHWWEKVFAYVATLLPVMLPFALATVVGGIDCTESAAAAGDEYDTRSILWTEGIASVLAGLAGGVIQTTPYIGQPAYKTMGGRAAYTLATAIFIGLAGCLGWISQLFNWIPQAACFPILVFVGLEIGAQSFRATPTRHYPAVALAILPALAYMATIPMEMALGPGREPVFYMADKMLALRCLAHGFIVTSLLWASCLSAILDRRMYRAALFLVVAAACSLVGVIHSPLAHEAIAWPSDVVVQMRQAWESIAPVKDAPPPPALMCQTPYHWAGGYLLAAVLLAVLGAFKTESDDTC